ncbi:MAG: hypothetical protein M1820_007924 [Bogoriella megaspora]|nr:MAG: hypothetical protein M1820_007924 [Bogoriella megaspora]
MSETLARKMDDEPNPLDTTGLCLLSLDGGGVRGLSSLYILQGLMRRLNDERQKKGSPPVKPCEVFDLIGGTSTGGLIAIMLGRLEMTVDACIGAYRELMKLVFEAKSSRIPVGLKGKIRAQFDSGKLRKAIKKVIADSGASETDLFNDGRERGCRVFVCSTARETAGITRIRSYSLPNKSTVLATICEAAMATSAATGFFDTVYIGAQQFVDGALGANNPAEEVEEEAANIWCPDSRNLQSLVKCFISVGTGRTGKKAIEDSVLSLLRKTFVEMVTETEMTEKRVIARWAHLFTAKRYFRLNVEQGLQEVGLVEYKEEGRIKTVTDEYLDHTQQDASVKNCVMNLKEKQKPRVFCNLPLPRNPRFVGRDEQLELLLKKVLTNHEGQKLAVHGLGGIGKTQIALELAYRVRDVAPGCSIFWIPAMNRESLEQTYADIVQELQIAGWQDKGANKKALLQRHLSQESIGGWLLIFDNADNINMWLEEDGQKKALVDQLPRSKEGCILFTSRDRKAAVKLAHQEIHTVVDADEKMAMQLLDSYLVKKDRTHEKQQAMQLLNELTFLPLAIVQAAAYINENDLTLAKYVCLLTEQEKSTVELLSKDFEDDGRYRGMKNPVATTWLISFEQICGRDFLAAEYLSFMACVERTNIPKSMLPAGNSRVQETDAIGLLKAYSFVVEKNASETLDMHRLVHLATRSWLRSRGDLAKWETRAMTQLSKVFPDDDHTNRSVWRLYLPHARRTLGYEPCNTEDAKARRMLLWNFSGCLQRDGSYKEAEIGRKELVEFYKGARGDEHRDTLASIDNLALVYRCQGRLEEAEALQSKVLKITLRVLGEEHPEHLACMNHLALTYREQGQYLEAKALQSRVLEISLRVLGAKHPETLTCMINLATTYMYQGQYREAEVLQLKVLEITLRVLGDEHPYTLTSMANLALSYKGQGRYTEAEVLLLKAFKICSRVLGEEHPSTLTRMHNLASLYWSQHRLKKAETLEAQVIEMRKRVLGERHPETLRSMHNLALTREGQGHREEAIKLMSDCVRLSVEVIGARHPHTLASQEALKDWQMEELDRNSAL